MSLFRHTISLFHYTREDYYKLTGPNQKAGGPVEINASIYIMHVCKGQGPPSASDIHVHNAADTLVVAGRRVLRVS